MGNDIANRPLSAFAARRALRAPVDSPSNFGPGPSLEQRSDDEYFEVREDSAMPQEGVRGNAKRGPSELLEGRTKQVRQLKAIKFANANEVSNDQPATHDIPSSPATDTLTDYETDGLEGNQSNPGNYEAFAEPRRSQEQTLSKLAYNSQIRELDRGAISVVLKAREAVTLIGHFMIWVRRGNVTIMGTLLSPSSKSQVIFAPSTHALVPVGHAAAVSAPSTQDADIVIESVFPGLRGLSRLSPSFQSIWNHQGNIPRSFAYVRLLIRMFRVFGFSC
jgi:polynucleotide 5'-hydroxyl-kinase GRC3/NOL9